MGSNFDNYCKTITFYVSQNAKKNYKQQLKNFSSCIKYFIQNKELQALVVFVVHKTFEGILLVNLAKNRSNKIQVC